MQRKEDREPPSGPNVASAQLAAFREWERYTGERFDDFLGFGGSGAGSIGIATSERLSPRWYHHSPVASRESPGPSDHPNDQAPSAPSLK